MTIENLNVENIETIKMKGELAKEAIVPGEEALHNEFSAISGVDEISAIMAMDCGSTQTRGSMLILGDNMTMARETFIIPSSIATIEENEELKPESTMLYDNMDSTIISVSNNKKLMVQNERVIRGRKLINFGGMGAGTKLSTAVKKTKDKTFYINIIDGIGYTIMRRFKDNVPKKVTITLGVALPPDDIQLEKFFIEFKERLLGEYTWVNNDLGVSMRIVVKDIVSSTEVEAQVKGYCMLNGVGLDGYSAAIDMGGRSSGTEIFDGVRCVKGMSETSDLCGTKFAANVNAAIIAGDNPIESNLDSESLRRAIRNGYVKVGKRGRVDILPILYNECKKMAYQLKDEYIKKVLEKFNVKATTIETIFLSGGPTRKGAYNLTEQEEAQYGEISIARFFTEAIDEMAGVIQDEDGDYVPAVEVMHIEDNYIAQGLVLLTFQAKRDFLLETEEDEEGQDYEVQENESNDEEEYNEEY